MKMAKKIDLTLTIPAPKKRVHAVLFDPDSPFKPKKVKSKKAFKRRAKHQKSAE
jgi:hypothetical protein